MKLSKKIASAALAGVMAMSLTVPAFASANSTITSTYEEQEIAVTVPETGTAMINPYGLDIKIGETGKALKGQQIAMQPLTIVNGTKMDLAVSATVTGEASGDLILASSAPARDAVTKSAYVFLQMKTEPTLVDAKRSTADGNIQGFDATTIATAFESWAAAKKPGANDIVLSPVATTKSNIITLKACTENATTHALELQADSVGLMRLAGTVVKSPVDPWAAADGFTANVALTFSPAPVAKSTVSLDFDKTAGVTVANGTPVDITLTITDSDTVDPVEIASVVWSSSDETKMTVVEKATTGAYDPDTGKAIATATYVAAGNPKVQVTVTDVDGAVYTKTLTVVTQA